MALRRCAAAAIALALAACATNPATGRRQVVLMSESQEIAKGREAAPQIAASMGIYADPELERYVEGIGMRMAKASERPDLPWQFRVVDDALVNAFAVPGGFIYVTRGILAHMDSEAELAGVLGHEIGHVTARHSVAQYTKAMGAQLVLLPAVVLLPDLQGAGQLLGAGLQVLMLKYGRDDERQSDELGLRYMARSGYRLEEMVDVFRTLERVGGGSDAASVPEWLSTHPSPANRIELITQQISQIAGRPEPGVVGHDELLSHLDGVVYGTDPREGFFDEGGVFHHPELAFRVRFPDGWRMVNQRSVVGAMAPEQDGMVQLTLAPEDTPDAAARSFLTSDQNLQHTPPRSVKIGGLPAVTADFAVPGQQGAVRGAVAFVSHGGRVFQILGAAPQQSYAAHEKALRTALASFGREADERILGIQPWRIALVKPKRAMSAAAFASAYPGPVDADELALMNQIPEGGSYAAGVMVKRVVGKPLP